ncbi:hypothetical protein V5P93_002777 [Actinokineospora auranticolor]|uniref:Uncharacterized protein n=1 Tax=Actinokineospora auranticolor TaxID=155976 RepID=A0A2S6H0C9_9PSEU|nr:hypothetical protein [Actinokineospora auranticolor]PPK70918.1 hypothetical protein CLV40_101104 [Actinokineospora auranticolor]
MSRLAVDPEALRNGGVNIRATVDLAVDICNQLFIAADTNRGAGGTGEIGEKFDSGYRPGEEQALKFLRLLQKSLGETGSRTITTAGVFRETDEDANAAVPP